MRTIASRTISSANSGSANVLLKKAPEGTGIIAGGVRLVPYWIWLVTRTSVQNPLVPNNKANVVLATLAGLGSLKTPEEVAKLRGKSVEEILN